MATRPEWKSLYETAAAQEGHFSTAQAAMAGYSRPLLARYLANGRIQRIRRGIYRIVHYPPSDHENLVVVWLWSDRQGVFSHETALALLDLSDVMPARVHITLPADWKRRRMRVPRGVICHHADTSQDERSWYGAIPVTSVARTLEDCALGPVPPDILRQAQAEAVSRGLIDTELPVVNSYLRQFAEETP